MLQAAALLRNAIEELTYRDPDVLTHLVPVIGDMGELESIYAALPGGRLMGEAEIGRMLLESIESLSTRGLRVQRSLGRTTGVGRFLCDSAFDAICTDYAAGSLKGIARIDSGLQTVLERDYEARRSPDGVRYFVRAKGERTVLIVNATGVPATVWRNLLGDDTNDWTLVLAESGSGDLVTGRMSRYVDVAAEVDSIDRVLDSLGSEVADVISWCNGAPIALELAARTPERIHAMVLISPMVCGLQGYRRNMSSYQRDLQQIFDAVTQTPKIAAAYAKSLEQYSREWSYDQLADEPDKFADMFFGLPVKRCTTDLLVPLMNAVSLVNVAARVSSDHQQLVRRLACPLLVVLGEHDRMINNEFVRGATGDLAETVVTVTCSAGGHYLQDLQYQYFRAILTEFLANPDGIQELARVKVSISKGGAARPAGGAE